VTAGTALEEETRPGPRFLFAVLLMGATELLAQVILARELLALFFGNELSIALVLAVWLLAVSAGSAAGARLAAGLRAAERALGWSQVFMAALLPLSLLAVRRIQPASITPGQVLGPGDMLLTSLATLSLAAAVAGFQFVVAAKAAAGGDTHIEGRFVSPIALVYALEALGSVIAGLAFHCYLAEHLLPFPTAAAVGLLNLLSAALLFRPRITPAGAARLLAVSVPAGFLVWLLAAGGRVEMATLRSSPRWGGLNPVDFVPSRYGALVVTDRAQQVSFYQSGVLLFTSQDDYSNETIAHLPLATGFGP